MESFPLRLDIERQIVELAAGSAKEVGGFVIAHPGQPGHRMEAMRNVHPEPSAHITFDPDAVVAAFARMDDANEDPVADFHSHPTGPAAVPSQRDVAFAQDLSIVHLVVAPSAPTPVRAWWFREESLPGGQLRRYAEEVPIRRISSTDALETFRYQLTPGNTVDLSWRSSGDDAVRSLARVRVDKVDGETVVVLVDRRQVRVSLTRIEAVTVIAEVSEASALRGFAARLLIEAAAEMGNNRVGSARSCVEAACHAVSGLRPRLDGEIR